MNFNSLAPVFFSSGMGTASLHFPIPNTLPFEDCDPYKISVPRKHYDPLADTNIGMKGWLQNNVPGCGCSANRFYLERHFTHLKDNYQSYLNSQHRMSCSFPSQRSASPTTEHPSKKGWRNLTPMPTPRVKRPTERAASLPREWWRSQELWIKQDRSMVRTPEASATLRRSFERNWRRFCGLHLFVHTYWRQTSLSFQRRYEAV